MEMRRDSQFWVHEHGMVTILPLRIKVQSGCLSGSGVARE